MFKSQTSLFKALAELGWTIVTNAKCNTYPYDPKRETIHQYVARNPLQGGYDVGFNITPDEIVATTDFYGGSVARGLGQDFCKLKTKYIMKVAEEAGYEEMQILEQMADGSMVVEFDDGL